MAEPSLTLRAEAAPFRQGGYHVLRGIRTSLLWLAEPADRLVQLARGRSEAPPLWLRRHTGPVDRYESAARELLALIGRWGLPRSGDRVVDVGCGTGVLVPGLLEAIGPGGRYLGFDVHAGSIAWCMRHYWQEPRCRFERARVASPYGRSRDVPVERYAFPAEDASADLVIAKSVFTHLLPDEARRYLAEIRRILRPGATAVVTAFLFEPSSRCGRGLSAGFPGADAGGHTRFRSAAQPWRGVAYDREFFLESLRTAGLGVHCLWKGFLPGDDDPPRGQDVLVLGP